MLGGLKLLRVALFLSTSNPIVMKGAVVFRSAISDLLVKNKSYMRHIGAE